MRARLGAGLLLALFAILRPAQADYEETEQRLKTAEVAPAQRLRIHKAIDACVAYLAARQRPDGAFDCTTSGKPCSGVEPLGTTLLVALALRHAGTPASEAPIQRAVAWLFDGPSGHTEDIAKRVYDAGLALMLLHAIGRFTPEAPRIASGLARGLDEESGWWGYDTPGPTPDGTPPRPTPFRANLPNLSTAQFAALGLWAARRMGIDTPQTVWRKHAEALLDAQEKEGSWPYGRGSSLRKDASGIPLGEEVRKGYFTGTCMGLANLLLAQQALSSPPTAPTSLLTRIDTAVGRARIALRRDARLYLDDPSSGEIHHIYSSGLPDSAARRLPLAPRTPRRRSLFTPGLGPYYTIYALEKACLFADMESFQPLVAFGLSEEKEAAEEGGPRLYWYTSAAKWLLSVQADDGGWSVSAGRTPSEPTNVVDSALALLVLVRSPSTMHPTTPREVDAKPRGTVTPGEAPPSK